ncbi:hypothetical protein PHIN3_325 [Sinorhizobium phage phiN3]|uniref:NadR/Ttd14 AAA domain-containing protein n=1 Tax=Sinorhizobium phage phiN3 TaxID=1647405 RepID=A0A0F6SJ50_9CAUD|nr:nicotinamide-nucleotide adenylyltransferase [Sinorhizobium phage phiN3]AKF13588.1 hypothetical protein PHIN3_325 [Sinorhizobium phage phiN3]
MKKAVVLMTALVPTLGHAALIRFASDLVGPTGLVDVIVSGRSFEPVPLEWRVESLRDHFQIIGNVNFWSHDDDDAPQNPATAEEWAYWRKTVVEDCFGNEIKYDYFVASEPYGKKMADLIGAQFVPFDIYRQILNIKGTTVRKYLDESFHLLIPEFQARLTKRVTIFGSESCGKTSMTSSLFDYGTCIHEFARPYLEMMDDKTITDEKMETIIRGQYALQQAAMDGARPVIIQDTDLLSTIGYYRIFGSNYHTTPLERMFRDTKSDLYIVMNDKIPFVPDPLRYGGDKRESDTQFWIDLLEEYNCNYYVVQETVASKQYDEVTAVLETHIENWFGPIRDFERE